jgi:hypothetical protein
MKKKSNDDHKENFVNTNIEKRLDVIISILLNPDIVKYTQLKKIEYLTKISFSNDEISRILGTTKNSVKAQKYKKPKVEK